MSTRRNNRFFICHNDCRPEGCQGHELVGELETKSSVIFVVDGQGKPIYSGNINKTKALLELLKSLDLNHTYFKGLLESSRSEQ